MAARVVAAAGFLSVLGIICAFCLSASVVSAHVQYSREELLALSSAYNKNNNEWDSIPPEILRSPVEIDVPPQLLRRHRRDRKQKRGKRGGLRARLQANPFKPTVPSVFLANTRSLHNKMDELRLRSIAHNLDYCIIIITETWLNQNIPDAVVELAHRTLFRADRTLDSGKSRGGGLCIYTHNSWCTNAVVRDCHCSPDLEYIMIQCRPFRLPREFTSVTIVAVYVPPQANVKLAMEKLHHSINQQLSRQPDSFVVIAGDFNQANLKSVLPKLHTYVNFSTRGSNTLDQVYCNIPNAYKARALPHVGFSDHLSLALTPAYKSLSCKQKPTFKTVTVWSEESTSALQDCFEDTDWGIFAEGTDLEEHTTAVLSYIKFCAENVSTTKTVKVYSNHKPWFTNKVKTLMKLRDSAYRAGEQQAYKMAQKTLIKALERPSANTDSA
ncbi:hypothetical protein WMY93_000138 [Mugilogobius chulae]|uniref:Endonuclease/exonuclease/phosphatase domain-containing protein n=1 Tax=Mugilogobius chulae TaxID=88201 RepID=A0AAW0Q954_9GOBI